jgi:hypothetical protein
LNQAFTRGSRLPVGATGAWWDAGRSAKWGRLYFLIFLAFRWAKKSILAESPAALRHRVSAEGFV